MYNINQGVSVVTNASETNTTTTTTADITTSSQEADVSVAQATLVCNILVLTVPVCSYSKNVLIFECCKQSLYPVKC